MVPDVRGMNISDARTAIQNAGLNIEAIGATEREINSPASKQDPAPGSYANPASTVRVEFIYMDGD